MQRDDTSAGRGQPPLEMAYYTQGPQPMLAVVRGVGALALVFGCIGLIFLGVQLGYERGLRSSSLSSESRFYVFNQVFGACVLFVLAVCLLVAGGGCLRHRPRGRRLLIVWAWAMLAWIAYAIVVTTWYLLATYAGRYPPLTVAYTLAYQIKSLCAGFSFPVIVIVLMRLGPIREVFDDGRMA